MKPVIKAWRQWNEVVAACRALVQMMRAWVAVATSRAWRKWSGDVFERQTMMKAASGWVRAHVARSWRTWVDETKRCHRRARSTLSSELQALSRSLDQSREMLLTMLKEHGEALASQRASYQRQMDKQLSLIHISEPTRPY